MVEALLHIDSSEVVLCAGHVLRFVDTADGKVEAVLYKNGKRVGKPWSLALIAGCSGDSSAAFNSNCAD